MIRCCGSLVYLSCYHPADGLSFEITVLMMLALYLYILPLWSAMIVVDIR